MCMSLKMTFSTLSMPVLYIPELTYMWGERHQHIFECELPACLLSDGDTCSTVTCFLQQD